MTVTHYFWDPVEDNVIEEYDENGDTIVEYETEPDLYGNLISQERDGVTSYYHYDGQGSTLALTNKDGDITDEYAYNAFGDTMNQVGTTNNTFRYIGEYGYQRDAEANAYSVRARSFCPSIVRWLSADPIHRAPNAYRYADNSPLRYLDPSGLENVILIVRQYETPRDKQLCGNLMSTNWVFALKIVSSCDGFFVQKMEKSCEFKECGKGCDDIFPFAETPDIVFYEAFGPYTVKDEAMVFHGIDHNQVRAKDKMCGREMNSAEVRFYCTSKTGDLTEKWPAGQTYVSGKRDCNVITGEAHAVKDKPDFWDVDLGKYVEGAKKRKHPIAMGWHGNMASWKCCNDCDDYVKLESASTPSTKVRGSK